MILEENWAIRRTRIRFEGEADAVAAACHRFFLTFLSAGG